MLARDLNSNFSIPNVDILPKLTNNPYEDLEALELKKQRKGAVKFDRNRNQS